MERFKEVKNTEGLYFVSNYGNVISRHKGGRKLLKPQNDRGYLKITISIKGKKKFKKIHRLVADAFLDDNPNKKYVNHKDGNRKNNHAFNLEWVTIKENNIANAVSGRVYSKLTISEVKDIKLKMLNGVKNKDLAEEYNVKQNTISAIRNKQNWKHVTI